MNDHLKCYRKKSVSFYLSMWKYQKRETVKKV